MKNRVFLFLILTTFFLQCQNKKEQENLIKPPNTIIQPNISTNQIKDILDKQSYLEKEETEDKYTLSEIDLNILSDLIIKDLKSKGYKELANKNFSQKINSIFCLNIKCIQHGKIGTRYLVYHGNLLDGTQNTLEDNLFESYTETGNLFFDQKNKLFIPFILLKNVAKINGQNYSTHIPQNIIAQNKYLFNDSKANLVWLKVNDKEFLETLVKTFGYVQDKDLVNFVLQNNYKNVDQFEKIILNIRCNQETIFNKEVFDIIKSSSSEDQKKYLHTISDIIVKLMKDKNSILSKNFEKKAEILGKLAYYSSKIGEKNNMYYDFFSILNSQEGGKDYELEFNKNNYYNIPDFKKVWEETRTGGISYPGME